MCVRVKFICRQTLAHGQAKFLLVELDFVEAHTEKMETNMVFKVSNIYSNNKILW